MKKGQCNAVMLKRHKMMLWRHIDEHDVLEITHCNDYLL